MAKELIIATLPDRVIEKGIPSETVVAQMVIDKYVYGMPLHRQIDKYTRMGGFAYRHPPPRTG